MPPLLELLAGSESGDIVSEADLATAWKLVLKPTEGEVRTSLHVDGDNEAVLEDEEDWDDDEQGDSPLEAADEEAVRKKHVSKKQNLAGMQQIGALKTKLRQRRGECNRKLKKCVACSSDDPPLSTQNAPVGMNQAEYRVRYIVADGRGHYTFGK